MAAAATVMGASPIADQGVHMQDGRVVTLAMLNGFFDHSPHVGRLRYEERQFLENYRTLLQRDEVITPQALALAANADDFPYMEHGNAGTIEEAVGSTGTSEVDLNFWITMRDNIFIQHEDGTFLFLRNRTPSETDPNSLHIEFFNLETGRFEDLTKAMIGGLSHRLGLIGTLDPKTDDPLFNGKIKRNDVLLMFNKSIAGEDRLETFYDEETTEPLPTGARYYHQTQTGNFCQLHAINAMVGKYIVKPSELQRYIDATVNPDEAEGTTNLASGTSVTGGIDPSSALNYLKSLVAQGRVALNLDQLHTGRIRLVEDRILFSYSDDPEIEITEEFFANKTRAMFGLCDRAHASALRKDSDGGWVHIDSEHREQYRYETLTDFLRSQFFKAKDGMGGRPISFAFTIA